MATPKLFKMDYAVLVNVHALNRLKCGAKVANTAPVSVVFATMNEIMIEARGITKSRTGYRIN